MLASRWAIATVKNQSIRSGPLYDSHKVDSRVVTVRFQQVGRGLIIGDRQLGKPVKPAALWLWRPASPICTISPR